MKILILALTSTLLLTTAYGHGTKHDQLEAAQAKDELITGELIGLTCFIKHESKGPEHNDCFKECAQKGLPIGILTDANKIYQISGQGHADLKTENEKFLKFAGKKISAKGQVFSRGGSQMIVVKAVKEAK